ncbi:hypothetical protein XELAEV_18005912mg [Xenopus laevis]|uniref:Uncharacterized protein n=1 Tax=Xenopus laevis TaxID=8355 RepID=A0A974I3V3_XENLA|nr:hypothetical protein XELAEV_18005912mg [Xenopus laevis]
MLTASNDNNHLKQGTIIILYDYGCFCQSGDTEPCSTLGRVVMEHGEVVGEVVSLSRTNKSIPSGTEETVWDLLL